MENDISSRPMCGESVIASSATIQAVTATFSQPRSLRLRSEVPPFCAVAKSRPLSERAESHSARIESAIITTLIT